MQNDFYVDGVGSASFGARLLSKYEVGSTQITRSRQKLPGVQGWIPLATDYALQKIKLPVHIFAGSPRQAAEQKSRLDAALLAEPVELILPNGMHYAASLDDAGTVSEVTGDGCQLACTYLLYGYAHDPLQSICLPSGGGVLYAYGTAPQMACRLCCTASAAASSYQMAGVTWQAVSPGDTLVLDGIARRVLRNGANAFDATDMVTWPKLAPGENRLYCPDPLTVEYYPIWL